MSRIGIVREIEVDSFWHPKRKEYVWRVTVYFEDDSTPFRKFRRTQEEAINVASHYWEQVARHIKENKPT